MSKHIQVLCCLIFPLKSVRGLQIYHQSSLQSLSCPRGQRLRRHTFFENIFTKTKHLAKPFLHVYKGTRESVLYSIDIKKKCILNK